MKDKIKQSLRINHSKLDDEIDDFISACKADLRRIGVKKIDEKDPLILQAIKLFVKAQVDFEGQGERFTKAYEMLAQSLSLSGDYNV